MTESKQEGYTTFWKPRWTLVHPNAFVVQEIKCYYEYSGWEELVPFRGFGVGAGYPDNFQVGQDIFATEQEALLFVRQKLEVSKSNLEAQLVTINQRLEVLKP